MNTFKFKKSTAVKKTSKFFHHSKGSAAGSESGGVLGAFYSAGPVLSLSSLVPTKTISRRPGESREPGQPHDQAEQNARNHSKSCPGRSFSRIARDFFEPRFKRGFSHVRIHTCGAAVQMSKQLKAQAFTYGNNIFFNQGKYNPGTSAGKQLLAHELTHVAQQENRPFRIQRKKDDVVGCFRQNAQACLVHLHGSETTALNIGKSRYLKDCVNLVYIDHKDCRLLRVEVTVSVPKRKGKGNVNRTFTCCADPNRIFKDSVIVSQWSSWNNIGKRLSHWGCNDGTCRSNPACVNNRRIREAAQKEVKKFRDEKLNKAIKLCHGLTLKGTGISTAIVALHNNRYLNINNYKGSKGVTTMPGLPADKTLLEQALQRLNPPHNVGLGYRTSVPWDIDNLNPHIQENQKDTKGKIIKRAPGIHDYYLVTRWEDFVTFVQKGQHVVLQTQNPTDDGSFSVALKNERFITIEAGLGNVASQKGMVKSALGTLNVSQNTTACPKNSSICPTNICKSCP